MSASPKQIVPTATRPKKRVTGHPGSSTPCLARIWEKINKHEENAAAAERAGVAATTAVVRNDVQVRRSRTIHASVGARPTDTAMYVCRTYGKSNVGSAVTKWRRWSRKETTTRFGGWSRGRAGRARKKTRDISPTGPYRIQTGGTSTGRFVSTSNAGRGRRRSQRSPFGRLAFSLFPGEIGQIACKDTW